MNNFKRMLRLLDLDISDLVLSDNDLDPGKHLEQQITKRDRQYTKLLSDYIKITKIRNIIKEIHKWLFFWLIIIACIFGIRYVYIILSQILSSKDTDFIIKAIPAIIASLLSFVSTVIAVPMAITKFLFNTKEDDNITSIITHTQDHDSAGISTLKARFDSKHSNSSSSSSENNQQNQPQPQGVTFTAQNLTTDSAETQ